MHVRGSLDTPASFPKPCSPFTLRLDERPLGEDYTHGAFRPPWRPAPWVPVGLQGPPRCRFLPPGDHPPGRLPFAVPHARVPPPSQQNPGTKISRPLQRRVESSRLQAPCTVAPGWRSQFLRSGRVDPGKTAASVGRPAPSENRPCPRRTAPAPRPARPPGSPRAAEPPLS